MTTALAWFTAFHTLLSLVAIVAGWLAIRELMVGRRRSAAITTFLVTAILTSVTGFLFPYHGFTPAIGVGIVAMIVLGWTLAARRSFGRSGFWTAQFPLGVVISEYFLMFVLVAQVFAKLPALAALPPATQKPLFGTVQLVVLVVFVILGFRTTRAFRARAAA
ncbi:hypothetical protein RKE25_11655 [Dyella sp. BiH032]|uniref:hypothetical protein n=1 Tax=Dyella sp. BiH032 TaxID=3075430 RepID=UPI0028933D2E|nr:hypothetical protein [Dyella sp. BiH032]WNL44086.1 hypothetical protein RKE25_11655 [Dyella sp. BiH032]